MLILLPSCATTAAPSATASPSPDATPTAAPSVQSSIANPATETAFWAAYCAAIHGPFTAWGDAYGRLGAALDPWDDQAVRESITDIQEAADSMRRVVAAIPPWEPGLALVEATTEWLDSSDVLQEEVLRELDAGQTIGASSATQAAMEQVTNASLALLETLLLLDYTSACF